MPKIFALMAVQRQTAASRSARPWMRLQHGVLGGVPTTTPSNPLSKLAHTPSFRVSLGHVALEGVGLGVGFGFGFGFGFGEGQVSHELTRQKKRRLRERKRASEALVFELTISTNTLVVVFFLAKSSGRFIGCKRRGGL